MARVVFSNAMMVATDGTREAVLAAEDFRELTLLLMEQWPALAEPVSYTHLTLPTNREV